MEMQARKADGSGLWRVFLRAVAVGMTSFASLLIAAQVEAQPAPVQVAEASFSSKSPLESGVNPNAPSVAEEARRLETLLSQVRQEALDQRQIPRVPVSQPPEPAGNAVPLDPVTPLGTQNISPTVSSDGATEASSLEDLLSQVRQAAWAEQGITPPASESTAPALTSAPTPTPRAEDLQPDSTSSTDLRTAPRAQTESGPSVVQPQTQPQATTPNLDLSQQGLASTPIPAGSQRIVTETPILSPSLARQQNTAPPLIEPEPFLNRLEDEDIAAPLSRHSLIPFPGEDSVLLAAQPTTSLSDTRVELLQDFSIPPSPRPQPTSISDPSPFGPTATQPAAIDFQALLPGQATTPEPETVAVNPLPATSTSPNFVVPSELPSTSDPGDSASDPALPPLPEFSRSAPSSPLAATEGVPTLPILTPSLERTQPFQIAPTPAFETPTLQDLPPSTLIQPDSGDPLLRPQPFMGQVPDEDLVSPLQRDSLALVPILAQADPEGSPQPFEVAILPDQEFQRSLSPLERPPQRLFGFETGTILRHGEMMLHVGGNSFQNPNDFRTILNNESNRSNDLKLGFDIGLWDTVQLSLGAEGKDDTIFANLIAPGTGVSIIYQGIPVQLKWQAIETPQLKAALVTSAQFAANTVPGRIDNQTLSNDPSSRKVLITTDQLIEDALLAEDTSTYFSVAAPVTYQLDRQTRITLNPQVSFFPESIPVTTLLGSAPDLQNANIGFDGQRLDYFGTVVGLGLGLDYDYSRHIKFVADYTTILSGQNSIGQTSEDSIFTTRAVWNVGFKFAPNSRLGIDLYATNRFGPLTYSPANILAQPGGDSGVGLEFTYLPDLGTTDYQIYKRGLYPEASAFLSGNTTFSATVLPIGSAVYELAGGDLGTFAQTARFGLLDDLELVLSQSSLSRSDDRSLAIEGGLYGRLAVFPDRGQSGLAAALGAGLLAYEGPDTATTVALYGDFPMRFRNRNPGAVNWSVSPKLVIPTQASGDDNIVALSMGANWPIAPNTHLLGEYTPVVQGGNQLTDQRQPGQSGAFLDQRSSLFSLGLRQLFPTDNSLYSLDVYWSNTAGNTGLQGITALPDGQTRVGVRFTTLNGIPGISPSSPPQ